MNQSWTIVSLGGSLIVPDHIDILYVRNLRRVLQPSAARRYVIVCGGGATSRRYIDAAKQAGARPKPNDLDAVGIRAIEMNAEFVRMVFGERAHHRVFAEPKEFVSSSKHVLVCGAKHPGHSSDYNAVQWAIKMKTKRVVNLTNIDHVYNADPKKNHRAKPLHALSWQKYIKIVGTKWTPGLNTPFDPIAAKLADREKITVCIVNGHHLTQVTRALKGQTFDGTILHPKI